VGVAFAMAAAFFWFLSAASCFFCLSLDFGDLSPMEHRLMFEWSKGMTALDTTT
jgi:hypothetical protein